MARKEKNTVDYFPLVCKFGDSIDAIENIFGNDGFIVWVKLLQKLGRSEYHYIDSKNKIQWKIFLSSLKIYEETVLKIIDTLADFECIDIELWKMGVVYSEKFVNGIKDGYKNRNSKPLTKKELMEMLQIVTITSVRNTHGEVFLTEEISSSGITSVRNTQTKLKETKLKETKEEEKICVFEDFDFQKKFFETYEKNCKNLIPLKFERRDGSVLRKIEEFWGVCGGDFEYFEEVCRKANELVVIADNKIDFRSILNNHAGIYAEKYKKDTTAPVRGINSDDVDKLLEAKPYDT
jgi:hypothetical protein